MSNESEVRESPRVISPSAGELKKTSGWKSFFIVFAKIALPMVFVGVAAGWVYYLLQSPERPAQVEVESPALLVQVDVARLEPVTYHVRSQGNVSPRVQTDLVSRVSGPIVEVSANLEVGEYFKQDEILVSIDPFDYEIALRQAQSNLVRFSTDVDDQKVLAALDQQYRERDITPTGDGRSEISSPPMLADLKRAQAQFDSAQADWDRAKENLDRTKVRAPYDGIVLQKMVDVGQLVGPQSPVATIASVDLARIRLPLSLHELKYLDLPQNSEDIEIEVTLSTDLGGVTHSWQGWIVRSEGTIDPTSRVLNVVAHVYDPYNLYQTHNAPLRFGTYVSAVIEGKHAGSMFVLPRHAVTRGSKVWVVNEDDEIYPHEVTVDRTDEENVYISSGLNDGDTYCITPIDQPLPGMRVRYDG